METKTNNNGNTQNRSSKPTGMSLLLIVKGLFPSGLILTLGASLKRRKEGREWEYSIGYKSADWLE
jgi:hypothetical protein